MTARDDDVAGSPDDDAELTALARALRGLVLGRGPVTAVRRVADVPIHPGERALYLNVDDRTRRATSSGRLVCRELLRSLGIVPPPLLRKDGGAPRWPVGLDGTLAHDDAFAVGLAWAGGPHLWGIDIEPAEPLPEEIVDDVVVTDEERRFVDDDPVATRAVFCAKEAAYKATWLLHRRVLEFRDVVVTLPAGSTGATHTHNPRPTVACAKTPVGLVRIDLAWAPRLLAVASVRATALAR
jgi:4'-phosphopantetheinyl transferase EntD